MHSLTPSDSAAAKRSFVSNQGNRHSAPVGFEPRGWVREETEMNFYKTNTGEFLAIETKLHSSGGVTGIAWGGDTEWLEHKYSGRDGTEQAVADYFEGQS